MIKEKLSKLLEVKSLISLIATIVFAILAVRRDLSAENVMVIIALVFNNFFNYQNNKNTTGGNNNA